MLSQDMPRRNGDMTGPHTQHLSYEVRASYLFGLGLRKEILRSLAGEEGI